MATPVDVEKKGEPMREKYWGELDDQGKIERLRREVRHLKSQNRELMESMEKVLTHTHDCSGQPVTPFQPHSFHGFRGYIHGSGGGKSNDDVYI